jgi:hypothetical protein
MKKSLTGPRLIFCALALGICSTTSAVAQNVFAYASQKTPAYNSGTDAGNQKQELINVLKELNKQKGVYFLFSDQSFGSTLVNPVSLSKLTVEQILNDVLKNTGLTYKKISADTYVIVTVKNKDADFKSLASDTGAMNIMVPYNSSILSQLAAVAGPVTGHVVSKDGQPLPGVSVLIKGTNKGTTTNTEGIFHIDADKGDVLVFSYVGFAGQEIMVGDNSTVDVTLLESQQVLNEVVVTALGIQRQSKSLTYSVQKLNNADLTNVKDASFVNSLTGKVAGVTVTKSASGIGGSTRVVIRGNKSTRENQPLYVVDGVPLVNFSPAQPGELVLWVLMAEMVLPI